jgi:hypothetical protein
MYIVIIPKKDIQAHTASQTDSVGGQEVANPAKKLDFYLIAW